MLTCGRLWEWSMDRSEQEIFSEQNNTEKQRKGNTSRVIALVWFAVFSASTASVFTRYSTSPSLVLAAYRKSFAALMMLPVVLGNSEYRNELRRINKKTGLLCLLSGFFLAIHFWTYFLSLHNTTIAASQILIGMEVLFVAVFMFLTGQETFSRLSRRGIFIALGGSILVAYTHGGLQSGGMLFGNIMGLVSGLMLACYSIIGKKVREEGLSNNVYSLLVYGSSAIILDLMVLISPYHFTGYGSINYLMAFLMAVFNSLMGHSIFNWSFKYISPTLVAMIKLFMPVFASIWGLLLFKEIPSWNQLAGGVIVIIGIFLYIRNKAE